MGNPTLGARVGETIGILLLRGTRANIYGHLVAELPGLDATTYPVLSGVARLGPTTATRLAAEIGLDRSATTRYASRLEEAGYLRRTHDPHDARATLLELSDSGRRAIGEMRLRLTDLLDEVLATWKPAEAEQFTALLERFVTQFPQSRRANGGTS